MLRAREWSVSTAPASAKPGSMLPFLAANGFSFTTELAVPRSACTFVPHGMSAHRVINGYHVILNRPPARLTVKLTPRQIPWRNAPGLCAAHANGLRVQIDETEKPARLSAVSLFAHHLQLLGINPANWAKTPIG